MASDSDRKRAKVLANSSKGDIEPEHLLGMRQYINGDWNSGVYDPPMISYFGSDEQPHYFFSNMSKGLTVDGERLNPDYIGKHRLTGKRRSSMCITDEGVHFTVGRKGGDFHEFLPYRQMQNASSSNGVRMNKISIEASELRYLFATEPGDNVDKATEYINQRIETNQRNNSIAETSPSERTSPERLTLHFLQEMDEYEFEHLVARIWEKQGWTTQVTKEAGDRGVDIIARRDTPFEEQQLIQAKRYNENNKVGSEAIQRYSGLYARRDQVDAVVVVTTSDFTKEAISVAQNRNVKLIDGQKLLELINKFEVDV